MTSHLNAQIVSVHQHEIAARAVRAHHVSELRAGGRRLAAGESPRRRQPRSFLARLGDAIAASGWAMAPLYPAPWFGVPAVERDRRAR